MTTEESRSVVQRWLDFAAEGNVDAAFALFDENAVWSNIGSDYNNTYAQVFTVSDDRLVAVREYMDTALVDAVFGASTPA